ncbi:Wzz/FepE/Etk N-terminal domain-containing protein [Streptomyces olivaceiscleroticus]|uniref:Wzz/FepE/Etk N-terminal domain-containing protein n=1 Tax=Streptomyces olivaceiscleroticus TaxID=68245 RepID=A0ABP3L9D9_9ACTN
MTTRTTSASPAAVPLLDLQALVAAVRRRRRLWSSLALLGLLAGAAVAVLLPPAPSAVTTVLVAHEDDQPNDTGTLIRTDAAVLKTSRIAGKALRSLKSPEKPADFMADYLGTGLTNNLLQIEVTGDSDAEAVARAKALADAFIADHVSRMREAAKAEAAALADQRDRMRDELTKVNKAIGDRSPESDDPKEAASIETLFARRAELNSRISDFDERAAEAGTGTPKVVAGTQIVDAPRAVRHSLPKAVATDGAIGLVLGLVLGLALAAVGAVVADRPVLRRDIATHLGASVIAELPHRSGGRWQRRRTRAARERLTTTLARTVRGSTEQVSLLELGCARDTSALATDLTRALGAEGPVVGVGSVAPGTAWTDLPHLGTRTVLVVRAGHGSAAWLHTVARQLADQCIAVLGVVLIDPDPRDRTDGTLWDGLHTALRGRSERPARQTGTGRRRRPEGQPVWASGASPARTELRARGRVPDNDQEVR